MTGNARLLVVAAMVSAAVGFGSFHAWRHVTSSPGVVGAIDATGSLNPKVLPESDDASPAYTPAPTPISDQVPDLSLPDLEGRQHSLASFKGRPTVFNFWASWCAPCRREIPLLNDIQHNSGDNGIQIVGIAADLQSNVVEFVKKTRIDYRILMGEHEGSEAAARFGVPLVLPFSVFVSAAGQVVAVKVGELHRDEAMAMLAAIHELDAGKRDLAATRQQIAARLRELAVERAKNGPQADS
jgi:thiol-disulfide isomerase/thioredoxin